MWALCAGNLINRRRLAALGCAARGRRDARPPSPISRAAAALRLPLGFALVFGDRFQTGRQTHAVGESHFVLRPAPRVIDCKRQRDSLHFNPVQARFFFFPSSFFYRKQLALP